jgi:hypothetical protein
MEVFITLVENSDYFGTFFHVQRASTGFKLIHILLV